MIPPEMLDAAMQEDARNVVLSDPVERMRRNLAAALAVMWQPIETAPKDGTLFLAWAPSLHGLPAMYSLCAWHPDGGFCIDELREVTKWQPLPDPPKETA